MAERRRGAALEEALLDAAWAVLTEGGYANLTMEAVAARAGTSRPVLYRRWLDKSDLVRAAITHVLARNRPTVPDTGSLRGDVLALMHELNRTRIGLVTAMSIQLAEYFEETGTSPRDMREMMVGEQPAALDLVFDRAAARQEVDPEQLTDRIRSLPFNLLRMEMLVHMRAASDDVIAEIVDTIFLPLVTQTRTSGGQPDGDRHAR